MTIDSAFKNLKSNLELRESFDDLIQQKHKAVRSVIENINPKVETKLIGSLQRRTKIQPVKDQIFDIDILVILGSVDKWAPSGQGISIQDALKNTRNIIGKSDRYDSMNPKIDNPTVVFEYKDKIKVELVPAYVDNIGHYPNGSSTVKGRGYWVPKNHGWELADYDYEAKHLSETNDLSDKMLVPTIKMLKLLKNIHFQSLSSFYLEILATQTIPRIINYNKSKNNPSSFNSLIKDFFLVAKKNLYLPVKMEKSNSPAVSLTYVDSKKIENIFNIIYTYCENVERNISERSKLDGWKGLFGNAMPIN